jgi:hypothetical protein
MILAFNILSYLEVLSGRHEPMRELTLFFSGCAVIFTRDVEKITKKESENQW